MTQSLQITLRTTGWRLAVCKLPHAAVPEWAASSEFITFSKTPSEYSLVCEQRCVPAGQPMEGGWGAYQIEGTLDFALVGIIARISNALAQANISVFVVSTFDTDYVLVKQEHMPSATLALAASGCTVID